MSLSNKVITDFVKTTSNNKTKKQDTIVKGWIAKNITGVYSVKLAEYSDNNDTLIPARVGNNIDISQPVNVLIKNHTACVIGNVSTSEVSTGTKVSFNKFQNTTLLNSFLGSSDTTNGNSFSALSEEEINTIWKEN